MNESAKNGSSEIAAVAANFLRLVARAARVLWRLAIPSWRRLGQAARVTIALALLFVLIAWRYERHARVGESSRLALFKKQTDADIAQLRNLAASAVREANARALEVQSLEARRRKAEQAAEELRRHLVSLQTKESNEVQRVATLPTSEVAIRVAARLGLEASQLQRFELGNSKFEIGKSSSNTQSRTPNPGASGGSVAAVSPPPSGGQRPPLQDESLRKIETAFVELDACREQGAVKDQQVVNCREQSEANAAIIAQQNASIAKLNQALAAKDEILTRREAEHRAELKAARGPWLARLVRALEYVGVGIVIGTVMR